MDPLSALSLAVNIVQVIDVSWRIVEGARQLAKPESDGYLPEQREADEVASDVQLPTSALISSEINWLDAHASVELDETEKALREIADGCSEVANELIRRLRKLKAHGSFRGLAVIRTSLIIVWKRDEIEACKSRLRDYRAQLNTRVLAGIREHLKAIDRKHDSRFTALDAAIQQLADAIIDQRDVFTEKLDLHTDLLDEIKARQDFMNTSISTIVRAVSPMPGHTPPAIALNGQGLPLHDAAQRDVNGVDEDGKTALHKARSSPVAERLIDAMAKVNAEDFDGHTPLHDAVRDRRLDVVRVLLSRRANKEVQDELGRKAIDLALDCPAADFMLRYGGHDVEAKALDHLDNTGLMQLAWLGDMEGTEFYLSQGAVVDVRNKFGETPLMEVSRHGDVEIVKLLLAHQANPNVQETNHGNKTPLSLAASNNRIDVVRELIKKRALVELADSAGNTALDLAAFAGHWNMCRLLLTDGNANVGHQNSNGDTVLHCAVHRADMDFLTFLLRRNPPLDVRNKSGRTPLFDACSHRKEAEDFVEPLLKAGADMSLGDNGGYSPLSAACRERRTKAVQQLLRFGANPNKQMDASKANAASWAPLHEACFHRDLEIVRSLLDAGADPNISKHDGTRPLQDAVWAADSRPEIAALLVERGANLDATHADGTTPLSRTCETGNLGCVEVLLAAGANVEAIATFRFHGRDPEDGYTPLMRCVLGNKPQHVEALTRVNVNLNARSTVFGRTALYTAVQKKHTECVSALLKAGADVNTVDHKKTTPLMAAVLGKSVEMVRQLLVAGADTSLRDWRGCTAWIMAKMVAVDDLMRADLAPAVDTARQPSR